MILYNHEIIQNLYNQLIHWNQNKSADQINKTPLVTSFLKSSFCSLFEHQTQTMMKPQYCPQPT